MLPSKTAGFFVVTLSVIWLSCAKFCLGESTTCDKWALIARTMTGDGQYHTCFNNATAICTRYDCEGSLTERFFSIIEVDYCFGIQLNSCLDPLSMDFYLKIPSSNYSSEYRITHDRLVYLSDIGIPALKKLPVKPLLDFQLERDGPKKVLVSITLKLESSIGHIFFDQYEKEIVDKEEVPLLPCAGPLTKDTAGVPDKDFASVPCHTDKYPPIHSKVITPAQHRKPSDTLNQTCDFVTGCSQGETCEMTSATEGMCVCEPDYLYVTNLKICVSKGHVRLECQFDGDCGIYEECGKETVSSNQRTCQCKESYSWDENRRLCVISKHHEHPSHSENNHRRYEPSAEGTTENPANNSEVNVAKHKKSSTNTKYVVIAASAVGAVVFVAVFLCSLLFCRRRLRNRFAMEGGGMYASDTPMLADTDDDVDLVM